MSPPRSHPGIADSPVSYRVIPPSPVLARYVQFHWVLEGFAPDQPHLILPDGSVEIVFQLGDPVRLTGANRSNREEPGGIVIGQMRRPRLARSSGRVAMIGTRLKPSAAESLLNLPQCELADRAVDLDELWGRAGKEIAYRLCEYHNDATRVATLERALLARCRTRPAFPDVEAAVRLIIASGGSLSSAALSRMVNVSPRQLERRFRRLVGIGPKLFSRITRFQRLLRLAETRPPDWAALALECGYSDQPHLIKEFREFAGCSPSGYLRFAAEISRVANGARPLRFVGFLQDFSGFTDYAGFTTFRRLLVNQGSEFRSSQYALS